MAVWAQAGGHKGPHTTLHRPRPYGLTSTFPKKPTYEIPPLRVVEAGVIFMAHLRRTSALAAPTM